MEKEQDIIEETLEHFNNANLSSEFARRKIAIEIIRRIKDDKLNNKFSNGHNACNSNMHSNQPIGSIPPSGAGR